MNIVTPGASFTLNFIPKHEVEILNSCILTNKNKNTATTLVKDTTITYYDADFYCTADITATVAEGEQYTITIYNDLSVVSYTGLIYVTALDTLNEGGYTENTTTNEYITR